MHALNRQIQDNLHRTLFCLAVVYLHAQKVCDAFYHILYRAKCVFLYVQTDLLWYGTAFIETNANPRIDTMHMDRELPISTDNATLRIYFSAQPAR